MHLENQPSQLQDQLGSLNLKDFRQHDLPLGEQATSPLEAVSQLSGLFSDCRNAVRRLTCAGGLQNAALKAISTAERRTIRALYQEPR